MHSAAPPTFSKPFLTLALLASGDPLAASVTWSRAAARTVVRKQGQQTVSPEGQGPGPSSWGWGGRDRWCRCTPLGGGAA